MKGTFALHLRLDAGRFKSSISCFLKPLLDGVIAAMHTEEKLDEEAVARLANAMGWDPEQITGRLLKPTAAIFPRRVLLRRYREFVSWNPADHLCTSCVVEKVPFDDSATGSIIVFVEPSWPSVQVSS